MDLRGYKTAPAVAARWPSGGVVALALLSRHRQQRAEAEAESAHLSHGCEPKGLHFELTRRAFIVGEASGVPVEELLDQLSARDLASVFDAWASHQERAGRVEHLDALRDEVRKRVNDNLDVMLDGRAAVLAESPSDFYGKPMVELTDAQIDYFTLVRAAFKEFWLDGDGKAVSKQWLRST